MEESKKSILYQIDKCIKLGRNSKDNDNYDNDRYKKLSMLINTGYDDSINLSKEEISKILIQEISTITPKVSVEVIVANKNGEVLVLNRNKSEGFCLPCGWIDVGESHLEATIRETKEETNLDIEPVSIISVNKKGIKEGLEDQIGILIYCKMQNPNQEVQLSHEHIEYKWINNAKEIEKWFPYHDILVSSGINYLKKEKNINFNNIKIEKVATSKDVPNKLSFLYHIYAIAREGLFYSKNKNIYQKLLDIVVNEYSVISDIETNIIKKGLLKEFGCITPKVSVMCNVESEEKEFQLLPNVFIPKCSSSIDVIIKELRDRYNVTVDAKKLYYKSIKIFNPSNAMIICNQICFVLNVKLKDLDKNSIEKLMVGDIGLEPTTSTMST